MIQFDEFFAQFTKAELDQMIADYEYLQKHGSIGDCLLRTAADYWGTEINSTHNVVLVMRDLAFSALLKRYHQMRGEVHG